MSQLSIVSLVDQANYSPILRPLPNRLLRRLQLWHARWQQRRVERRMQTMLDAEVVDPRLRRDIGLGRLPVSFELQLATMYLPHQ